MNGIHLWFCPSIVGQQCRQGKQPRQQGRHLQQQNAIFDVCPNFLMVVKFYNSNEDTEKGMDFADFVRVHWNLPTAYNQMTGV